ncbi:MAG: hypothetical protein ATN34_04885 [Epulopiscium sp. Nele67-Bin002]|nr:MAG: hypothetical protein ATN34_04885 [Epulopiscium sp. Nele67-Bin002]OON94609.1 MAG: hypothetical protein ATN33_04155 [Epulopiscium sp. Nele67-Bin001]
MIATKFHEINTFIDNAATALGEVQNLTNIAFPAEVATPILKKVEVLQDLLSLINSSNMNTKMLIASLRHALVEAGIILVKLTDGINVDTVESYQTLEKLVAVQVQLSSAKKKVGDDLTNGVLTE